MLVRVRNSVSTLLEATDEERDWLREYLSFDDESKAFRKNRVTKRVERVTPPKVRLFDRQSGHFPTGVLPLIARRVEAEGGELLLEDDRTPPVRVESHADLRWLRPYQLEALRTVLAYERGILWIATGGGKTEVAIALTRVLPCRWLFVVHRAELMHQTARRWERRFVESQGVRADSARGAELLEGHEVGMFGDGKMAFGQTLTVATFQTLHSKMKTPECRELFRRTDGLIVDECFPAGTEIGGVPVESLTVGDYIPSYNPETNRVEAARIGKVFVRPVRELVRLGLSNGESVVCTPNHPLMTPMGYQPAVALAGTNVCYEKQNKVSPLRTLRGSDRTDQHGPGPCGVLPGVQKSSPEGAPQSGDSALCALRGHDRAQRPPRFGASKSAENLLRGPVSQRGLERVLEEGGQPTGRSYTRTNDGTQPNEQPANSAESFQYVASDGALPTESRGQRLPNAGATASHGGGPRLGRRACHTNKANNPRNSKLLQGGPGQRGLTDRSGDRRVIPWDPCQASPGQEKDNGFGTVRVESVEVLQPGSDGKFGGLCLNGFVYNFHIPGNETYIVGNTGLIAHNCHTLPSTTFFGVAMQFHQARYRVGLSGTPLDRDDKRSFMAIGALGPVIHRVKSETLVEAGVLARPLIRMVEVEQEVERPTYQGVYGEGVVRSATRNKMIARIAAQKADRPSVVFYKELRHGRQLQDALERRGLRVGLVAGSTPVELRQRIAEDLARGELDTVVASVVWQEGIDIPEIRALIIAAAGKSIIATLQRAGRGTRRTKNKTTFEIWDIFDVGTKALANHATARRSAYRREGFEVTVLKAGELENLGKA